MTGFWFKYGFDKPEARPLKDIPSTRTASKSQVQAARESLALKLASEGRAQWYPHMLREDMQIIIKELLEQGWFVFRQRTEEQYWIEMLTATDYCNKYCIPIYTGDEEEIGVGYRNVPITNEAR